MMALKNQLVADRLPYSETVSARRPKPKVARPVLGGRWCERRCWPPQFSLNAWLSMAAAPHDRAFVSFQLMARSEKRTLDVSYICFTWLTDLFLVCLSFVVDALVLLPLHFPLSAIGTPWVINSPIRQSVQSSREEVCNLDAPRCKRKMMNLSEFLLLEDELHNIVFKIDSNPIQQINFWLA